MAIVKNIIEYLAIVLSLILIIVKVNSVLKYYQQSHYHLSSFKKIIKYYYLGKWQYFIFGLLVFIMLLDKWYVGLIFSIYLCFLLVINKLKKNIMDLKITARIYRNYLFILIVFTLIASSLLYLFELPELTSAISVILLLLPFLVFVSSIMVLPVEYLVAFYYHFKAKNKLKKIQPIIIGITGSFGKTSTKNILYEFLKNEKQVIATRKSFNTLNGISICINEDLSKNIEIMIVEMGASKVGDISKLHNLIKPNYAILTGITSQHLESFKTIENIIQEKIKIIENLDEKGIAFINGDDEYLKTYHINSKAKLVKFGLDPANDFHASNIELDKEGMRFQINFGDNHLAVKTKLLGKHNIYNILAAFSIALNLNIKLSEIVYNISVLEATKHRLSLAQQGTHLIIDDSFNSNKIGFVNALEVLNYFSSPKILITPGIVEAGSLEESINYELSSKIIQFCDEVVLVKTKASSYILKGLIEHHYDKYKVVEDFKEAQNYVFGKYQKASILIENDVSDIYKI